MTDRSQYGTTAKVFHWLVVALLLLQFPIGWLMPDIHRGDKPGAPMTFHVSFGIVILALILLRFAWRLTHPVLPESSLPAWQRLTSEAVHWALYVAVLATTVSGWLFASFRGRCRCWARKTPRRARSSTAGIRRRNGRCWC
jgi:cytochrome b561